MGRCVPRNVCAAMGAHQGGGGGGGGGGGEVVPCLIMIRHREHSYKQMNLDQVHVVRQGVLGVYIDNTATKLKRPKKITSRWVVLTRCEKTGQHTLHICKTDSPDSSVKESFPVLTSWSIKSAHCLKSAQRMDIFKEEGFIVHMGRQVLYLCTPTRADCKGWMCAVLEGVTLGFEYHCVCGESLGVNGDCMLVLTPECIALLCPLTGAPLRKWPYFVLKGCNVMDDTLFWSTRDSDVNYTATVHNHNTLTLYNVLCRYMAHTNPGVQVDIRMSKVDSRGRLRGPAENKYSIPSPMNGPTGLRINELYRCQDGGPILGDRDSQGKGFDAMSSSDYSTGMSSSASTYDSDIYEPMEASRVCDSIYEDMATASSNDRLIHPSSSTERLLFNSSSSSAPDHQLPPRSRGESSPAEMYINMDRGKNTPAPPPAPIIRPSGPNYEYIDIDLSNPASIAAATASHHPAPSPASSTPAVQPPAPQLPTRNKPKKPELDAFQRAKISAGLRSYQQHMQLEKELMVNFSATVLDSSEPSGKLPTSHSRTFMNSAV